MVDAAPVSSGAGAYDRSQGSRNGREAGVGESAVGVVNQDDFGSEPAATVSEGGSVVLASHLVGYFE
ncbi:hypothetical protein EES43_11410 [Streptomyces sp. ADI96-02]|uniref:hypothetical protein n=1 Tax=Streptomyces sp. ADI96-02 TaxID=1522760 RepID=UPI000F550753|nr:hypothetical protein [Streptomyces sp. ADI96-02]RPK63616.1 hypothetical protein EES43_11410 [Streptomyces sp. ADI96-02]